MRNYCGGPTGAFKAPVQMRMSLSGRQTDRHADGQTDQITKAANKDRRMEGMGGGERRAPCFRNSDFPADGKRCLSCCNIHVSDRTQGVSGLIALPGWGVRGGDGERKGRNNQKCIRNNALFRLYPSLFRHPSILYEK